MPAVHTPGVSVSDTSSKGTTVFVLGLLSLVLCPLLGPIAWQQGNDYENMCMLDGIEPDGLAKAGRILGMVGTGLLVLQGLAFLLMCCAGMADGGRY